MVSAGDAYKDFFGPLVSEGVFDKGAFYNMGTKLPIFSDLAASTNSIINLTKKFGKQAEDACYRSWTMRPYESRIASRVRESVGQVVSAIAGAVKGAVKVASKAAGAAAGAVKAGVKASVKAVTGVGGKATPPATPAPPAAAPAADTELVTKAAAKPMFAWKNCRPVVANGEKLYDTELYASVFCLRVDCPATFSGFANNGKCGFMCATDEFCRDVVANVMSDIIGLAASTASLAMQGGTNPITILSMVTKILSLMDTIIQPKCKDVTISPKL